MGLPFRVRDRVRDRIRVSFRVRDRFVSANSLRDIRTYVSANIISL